MITRAGLRAMRRWLWVGLACGTLALSAHGQTPAPAAQPSAIPKPDCGEKPRYPGPGASELQQREWRKDANAYLECFKKFASDQRALAQQYLDAANAVIDQYNATVKEMQAESQGTTP
jgi:hypothetical protein